MKKILFILFFLPLSFLGQETKLDAIIFIDGDTIYGNIIEVGTEEITYTYKGESIKNKTRISVLAKIDFASGRIQDFKGLDTFIKRIENERNALIEKEKKEERITKKKLNNNRRNERKSEEKLKRKELTNESERWSLKIGCNLLIPFDDPIKVFDIKGDYKTLPGINTEISYIIILNKNTFYNPSINIGRVNYKYDQRNNFRTLFSKQIFNDWIWL